MSLSLILGLPKVEYLITLIVGYFHCDCLQNMSFFLSLNRLMQSRQQNVNTRTHCGGLASMRTSYLPKGKKPLQTTWTPSVTKKATTTRAIARLAPIAPGLGQDPGLGRGQRVATTRRTTKGHRMAIGPLRTVILREINL